MVGQTLSGDQEVYLQQGPLTFAIKINMAAYHLQCTRECTVNNKDKSSKQI